MSKTTLRIATRTSPLALAQTQIVQQQLLSIHPDLVINIVGIKTWGDKNITTSLQESGGKSVFVKELQQALVNNDADFAVHSVKDMSVFPTEGLKLISICQRGSPNDVLISRHYDDIKKIPSHATIGTSSPRRQSQIKALLPTCNTTLCRGNINTRLSKLHDNEYDAILLAQAGLHRLKLSEQCQIVFPINTFIPAIGQGAIGLECRDNDAITQSYLQPLNHIDTARCVIAERCVNAQLHGDCYTPIAAHAIIQNQQLHLTSMVGSLDGQKIIRATATGHIDKPEQLGKMVATQLLEKGAQPLLDAISHSP